MEELVEGTNVFIYSSTKYRLERLQPEQGMQAVRILVGVLFSKAELVQGTLDSRSGEKGWSSAGLTPLDPRVIEAIFGEWY